MIDFVIVEEVVVDEKSFRGVSIGTKHYLVVYKISVLFKSWR